MEQSQLCDGFRCSTSLGLDLDCCVARLRPPPDSDTVAVVRRNGLRNTELETLENLPADMKRQLLYSYYAITIFQEGLARWSTRIELPHCVRDAIRAKYPAPDGVYKGFIY